MPNIASVLKSEIARVARKEARGETEQLKKSSSQHRTDLAAMKKQIAELKKMVARLSKAVPKSVVAKPSAEALASFKFKPTLISGPRKKLGLNAMEMGLLLGVSDQSVYKWENGTSIPRASQHPAIAALKTMSKEQADALLEKLKA